MIVEISHERAVEIIEKISRYIAERRMAAPAIMAIESLRPLNFIGSQVMYFLAPFAEVIFKPKEYEELAALIEKEEYINLLLKRIDELDIELFTEQRKQERLARKRRWKQFKNVVKKIFIKKNGGKNEQ